MRIVYDNWDYINKKFSKKKLAYNLAIYQKHQKLWKAQSFTKDKVEKYLDQGFEIEDFMFISWIRDNSKLKIENLKIDKIESLRKKYLQIWTNLDVDFNNKIRCHNKNYRQIWEFNGINYNEAKEWINLGKLKESSTCCWPNNWIENKFSLSEVRFWLDVGFKLDDYFLVSRIRSKNIQYKSDLNIEELRKEKIDVQDLVNTTYPLKLRNTIYNLNLNNKKLIGPLILKDFDNLTEVNLRNNSITSLEIFNCPKLTSIYFDNNQLTNIDGLPTSLVNLYISNNKLEANLNIFSHLVNLKELEVSNNNRKRIEQNCYNKLTGSLQCLQKLNKLKFLNISNTDIDGGFEYLPESLKVFSCSFSLRTESQCQNIYLLLEKVLGSVKIDGDLLIKNFPKVFIEYKLKSQIRKNEEEIKLLKEERSKFGERDGNINYLENRVKELIKLIKNKREKIIDILSRLLPEKQEEINLIKNLIAIHLKFIKAKKQGLPSVQIRKERDCVREELEKMLGEVLEEEIEDSLTDCEELVNWEFELNEILQNKNYYIEEQKQSMKKINYTQENENIVNQYKRIHHNQLMEKNRIVKLESKIVEIAIELKVRNEENQRLWEKLDRPVYQNNIFSSSGINVSGGDKNNINNQIDHRIYINSQKLECEVFELKKKYHNLGLINKNFSYQNQLKKLILFLAAKQILVDKRQKTINILINAYQESTKSKNEYYNYIDKFCPLIDFIPFPKIAIGVKLFNQSLNILSELLKSNSFNKQNSKIEQCLIEDEKSLVLLQETYNSLNSGLNNNSIKINSIVNDVLKLNEYDFGQCSVFIVTNIQKNSDLKEEDIKNAINLLTSHLKELTKSIKSEVSNYIEQLENVFFSENGEQLQKEVEELLNKLSFKNDEFKQN